VHQAGPHRARLRRADPARAATTVSSEQAHTRCAEPTISGRPGRREETCARRR
jgi:hypothetical protein